MPKPPQLQDAPRVPRGKQRIANALIEDLTNIAVEHRTLPGNLDPEDWHLMKQIIDTIKAAIPPGADTAPSEILGVIMEALRVHFAKRVKGAA
jgi:hypothetical protein